MEDYLFSLLPKRDAVLRSIEVDAAKKGIPIVGPLVGNIISIIVKASKAETALELGTATGYSGIWIARALEGKNARLTTIEMNETRRKEAQRNFERAGVRRMVRILSGNVSEIVPKIFDSEPESHDLIFIDVGDKTLYVKLLQPCINLLREGGFLIADNTLWGGEVADPFDSSKATLVIRRFNKLVFADKRLQAAIMLIRDGLTVARKKSNK